MLPGGFESLLFSEIQPYVAPDTRRIVGVKFKHGTRIVDCEGPKTERYKVGEYLVIDTGRGLRLGEVLKTSRAYLHRGERLPQVVRRANDADMEKAARNQKREADAFLAAIKIVQARNCPFKIIGVEWADDGSKAAVYFCSEDRVEFRDFVQDLGGQLHVRIEMRQIGIRDQAGMAGGLGDCGRELCCSSWLRGFKPISIKMAKNQNLALDSEKITGQCGRLKCCLAYEDDTYAAELKKLPKRGFKFEMDGRRFAVVSTNVLLQKVLIQDMEGAQHLLEVAILNALLQKPGVLTQSSMKFIGPEAMKIAKEMAPAAELGAPSRIVGEKGGGRTDAAEKLAPRATLEAARVEADDLGAALRESLPEGVAPPEPPRPQRPQGQGGGGGGGRDRGRRRGRRR